LQGKYKPKQIEEHLNLTLKEEEEFSEKVQEALRFCASENSEFQSIVEILGTYFE